MKPGASLTKGLLSDKGINMKIGNVHISILAQKEGDNSAIVTSAKRALLYLLLRLGLRKVSTWIFNKQDI